jgi:hypothetical protein
MRRTHYLDEVESVHNLNPNGEIRSLFLASQSTQL